MKHFRHSFLHAIIYVFITAISLSVAKAQSATVSTGTIVGSPFCAGSAIVVPFTVTGTFNADNVFTAQLSDAAGSFSNPTAIGNVAATASGTINASLAYNQASGSSYLIRVVASSPATTGNSRSIAVSAGTSTGVKNFIGKNDWNNPANWSPCGVPTTTDNISIQAGDTVVIPNGYNAVAKSVVVLSGGTITISAGSLLEINNSVGTDDFGNGILLSGVGSTLTNRGNIKIGNTGVVNLRGLYASFDSKLVNESGANIYIDNIATYNGLVLTGSTTTNAGNIYIGTIANINLDGIYMNNSTISNTGYIEINRAATSNGVLLNINNPTFTNSGILKIGNAGPISQNGIRVASGTFNNSASGTIEIDSVAVNDGISVSTAFNNYGSIKIGSFTTIAKRGIVCLAGTFRNFQSGTIEIYRTNNGVQVQAPFTNDGVLKIGGTAAVRGYGISSSNAFANSSTGTIEMNNINNAAVYVTGNSFSNSGTLKIGNTTNILGNGIFINGGSFSNSGNLDVDGIAADTCSALATYNGGVVNTGTINLGKNSTVVTAIKNASGTGTFTNNASINFGSYIQTNGIASGATVTNSSAGTISTTANGILKISGTLTNSGIISNSATGAMVVNGTLTNNSTGTITNNGVLKGSGTINQGGNFINTSGSHIAPGNSTGILSIAGDFDLGSTTLDEEINGSTEGSLYDVLNVTGLVSLGNATLNIMQDPSYTIGASDIIRFINANSISGNLNGAIPTGTLLLYNHPASGKVSLRSSIILPLSITSFTAAKQLNTSILNWKVAHEENIATYTIERSVNGRNFTTVGSVASLGNTTAARVYSFTDAAPVRGANYYRLKITEKDGKVNYSEVRLLNFGSQISIALYPNPAKDRATITGVEAGMNIRLLNATGQLISNQKANSNTIALSLNNAGSGLYSVEVYSASGQLLSTARLVKE